jgi:hypothetical protein
MRYMKLNPASNRLEEGSTAGRELFVNVQVFRRSGDGFHPVDLRDELVALSSLVDLIVDEIAVRDQLAAEERKREKEAAAARKKVKVAA